MLIVTTESVAGREVTQTLGLVRGATVRAKHLGTDIVAALKMLVGGELTGYSSLMAGAREQALDRMAAEAEALGADAVICMRMQTSAITRGASEIVAYGTAVKLTS
ncbi:YbjQ family protein [Mameliella sediminis]|uniref:YbjQ family protein n=1 Tax=Mameliella sediminis TaxID=2836866 RepID=UPI001C4633E3|nr:YbjQ family protein [Mameliella sediminis]MBY6114729.1 YbjQ family protein [Antarctobacter heliothermus]MBY6144302.1 YbjQ family protein [Mameliella alba]MBV7392790.1 YbjQ family protein [Mameliella sediminis]MBY6161407.1 YbjQ family protein [Mameliella alba]MBY6170127.1 YbjQ family protein [Mameliella alba]